MENREEDCGLHKTQNRESNDALQVAGCRLRTTIYD
jgi:hypothetical protein